MSEITDNLYVQFLFKVENALDSLETAELFASVGALRDGIALEPPRDAAHGDLATNAALVMSKRVGLKPRDGDCGPWIHQFSFEQRCLVK